MPGHHNKFGACRTTGHAVLLLAFSLLQLACTAGRQVTGGSLVKQSSRRHLTAIDLPVGSVAEGWTLGRASFDGPPTSFNQSFTEKHFGAAASGDCGLYRLPYKSSFVPSDMLAAAATSNSDYPGSCGRCYELRCVNGIIPGNYSSDNTPVPYAIAQTQLDPVYAFHTITGMPPLDSYNRTFPGNVLNASSILYTQCWNASDAEGLLSPSQSIYVQVSDSCHCSAGSTDACCTNIPHFNLGYSAFEKLAHPDYGLMNLAFSPVACDTKQPVPLEPGTVSKTIYSDDLGVGWGAGGYQTSRQLQQPGQGLSRSNAACFTMQNYKEQLFFFCRDCDQPGYQPFLLSNTSGLELFIKSFNITGSQTALPQLSLSLGYENTTNGKVTYTQLCSSDSVDLSQLTSSESTQTSDNSYIKVSAGLFQNSFKDCIPILNQVTTFALQPSASATAPISFCLDNITLTDSMLQPNEPVNSSTLYRGNCIMPEPKPIYQDGSYVTGQLPQLSQTPQSYTMYPFADLQNHNDMTPTLGSCFTNYTGLSLDTSLHQQVDACMSKTKLCCYSVANAQTEVPGKLAQICDSMASNGSICQGFVYDSSSSTAFFKGSTPGSQVDTGNLCLSPNITAWVLTTAAQGQPDTRRVASAAVELARPVCQDNSQPDNQDLQLWASQNALPASVLINIAGNPDDPSSAYTVNPNTDLQNYSDLVPPSGASCLPPGAANLSAVNTCSQQKQLCCVSYDALSKSVDSSLPDTLANICNSIQFSPFNNVCQGFVYDHYQNVAFFKVQTNGKPLDPTRLCSSSNSTAWLRNTATTTGGVTPQPTPSPPSSPPAPANATSDNTDNKIKTVYGILVAVVGAAVPALTWLALTYSYRKDKQMVVKEVVDSVTVAHIAPDSQAAATAAPLSPQPLTGSGNSAHNSALNPAYSSAQGSAQRSAQSSAHRSAQSSAHRSAQSSGHSSAGQIRSLTGSLPPPTRASRIRRLSTNSSSSSSSSNSRQQLLSPPPQALLQSAATLNQLNPLLHGHSASLSSSSSGPLQGLHSSTQSASDSTSASKDSKAVAKQITVLCLRRWDGFLGIRAGSDGLGRRRGIWRDKSDGVHSAVLLLAMLKLNQALRNDSTNPSSIQTVWQQNDRKQRNLLLNQLARILLNVSEEEAQALPDKDPDTPGLYDKLCSMLVCCNRS